MLIKVTQDGLINQIRLQIHQYNMVGILISKKTILIVGGVQTTLIVLKIYQQPTIQEEHNQVLINFIIIHL